jgi:hypothetical protein
MSTRSFIAAKEATGYRAIYCHSDGYDSHQLPLLANYDTPEKVASLLDLGSLSTLGAEIGEKHNFDLHQQSKAARRCLAYHRDREESAEATAPMKFKLQRDMIKAAEESSAEYLYVWVNGRWTWRKL